MYFWRIKALTEQLRRGPLEQRAALLYILAWLILWMVPFFSGDSIPRDASSWAMDLVYVVATVLGTLLAYQANGGAHGNDFAARYFALGWVLAVRLVVLFGIPVLVLMLLFSFVSAFLAVSRGEPHTGDAAIGWAIAVLMMIFEILYYWRLMHHFSIVRGDTTAPPVDAERE
jgi:hypothetical protein